MGKLVKHGLKQTEVFKELGNRTICRKTAYFGFLVPFPVDVPATKPFDILINPSLLIGGVETPPRVV